MSDSTPPEAKSFVSKVKSLATLIAALAALATAIGAFLRPQDHSVTKSSYETLSLEMKRLSEDIATNHDDIEHLKGYVEALATLKPEAPITLDAGAPLPIPSASAMPSLKPILGALGAKPRPSPPALAGRPPIYDPLSFDVVAKKK